MKRKSLKMSSRRNGVDPLRDTPSNKEWPNPFATQFHRLPPEPPICGLVVKSVMRVEPITGGVQILRSLVPRS